MEVKESKKRRLDTEEIQFENIRIELESVVHINTEKAFVIMNLIANTSQERLDCIYTDSYASLDVDYQAKYTMDKLIESYEEYTIDYYGTGVKFPEFFVYVWINKEKYLNISLENMNQYIDEIIKLLLDDSKSSILKSKSLLNIFLQFSRNSYFSTQLGILVSIMLSTVLQAQEIRRNDLKFISLIPKVPINMDFLYGVLTPPECVYKLDLACDILNIKYPCNAGYDSATIVMNGVNFLKNSDFSTPEKSEEPLVILNHISQIICERTEEFCKLNGVNKADKIKISIFAFGRIMYTIGYEKVLEYLLEQIHKLKADESSLKLLEEYQYNLQNYLKNLVDFSKKISIYLEKDFPIEKVAFYIGEIFGEITYSFNSSDFTTNIIKCVQKTLELSEQTHDIIDIVSEIIGKIFIKNLEIKDIVTKLKILFIDLDVKGSVDVVVKLGIFHAIETGTINIDINSLIDHVYIFNDKVFGYFNDEDIKSNIYVKCSEVILEITGNKFEALYFGSSIIDKLGLQKIQYDNLNLRMNNVSSLYNPHNIVLNEAQLKVYANKLYKDSDSFSKFLPSYSFLLRKVLIENMFKMGFIITFREQILGPEEFYFGELNKQVIILEDYDPSKVIVCKIKKIESDVDSIMEDQEIEDIPPHLTDKERDFYIQEIYKDRYANFSDIHNSHNYYSVPLMISYFSKQIIFEDKELAKYLPGTEIINKGDDIVKDFYKIFS